MIKPYKPRLTTAEHIELAEKVRRANELLHELAIEIGASFNKKTSAPLWRAIDRLNAVRSELDSDYHAGAAQETFELLGHIYYGKLPSDG